MTFVKQSSLDHDMNHTYRGKTLKAGLSKYPISQDNGSQTDITSAAIYLRSEKTSLYSQGVLLMVNMEKKTSGSCECRKRKLSSACILLYDKPKGSACFPGFSANILVLLTASPVGNKYILQYSKSAFQTIFIKTFNKDVSFHTQTCSCLIQCFSKWMYRNDTEGITNCAELQFDTLCVAVIQKNL